MTLALTNLQFYFGTANMRISAMLWVFLSHGNLCEFRLCCGCFFPMKIYANFGYVVGVSFPWKFMRISAMLWVFLSHGNLNLTSKNFKLVSQWKVNPFVVRQITIRKGAGGVDPEMVEVGVQR